MNSTIKIKHKKTILDGKRFVIKADSVLLFIALVLIGLGIVMVASASMAIADKQFSDPFYYMRKQCVYAALGLLLAFIVAHMRMIHWENSGMALMVFSIFLLVLILMPGVGRTVNGSTRWLDLGIFSFQVSELTKLFLLIYLAGYLVRRSVEIRHTLTGFLKPILILGIAGVLILLQPDFGSVVVLLLTTLGMLFISGVRFYQFVMVISSLSGIFLLLAVLSPYRLQRLTAFLDPWADPFNSGFQLTQSLIAFGSGGWFGTGLGNSVQKLFYLPEAHNDFLFAILAEELGLIGVVLVLFLYAALVSRGFYISVLSFRQSNYFGAYLAFGITLWFALQAMTNIGVSMGVLPTKGLTLPLMSSGGSSIMVMCISLGFLTRIYHETNSASVQAFKARSSKPGLVLGGLRKVRAA